MVVQHNALLNHTLSTQSIFEEKKDLKCSLFGPLNAVSYKDISLSYDSWVKFSSLIVTPSSILVRISQEHICAEQAMDFALNNFYFLYFEL